ncbi:TIGR03032 family protein [Oceanobacter mangrovi]|uniref:TIGR03032 family protein n=1 Tax=Oceanobacter mangrovi TaxID=2862510 RepID=UPI001C8E6761|nr:TIGR03032 family protein [Oceanobacter mangrovi]
MALARYTDNVPALLDQLGISLIVTSNTAGRVFTLAAQDGQLSQGAIRVKKPMGIALNGDFLAISHHEGVSLYKHDQRLAELYPKARFDKLFHPTVDFFSYGLNHHDLAFTRQGLVSVNTSYSCLARVDTYGEFSYSSVWQPPFVSKEASGDCCHLNGMAVDDEGNIRYATAFSTTDVDASWRDQVMETGVVMDVRSNRVVLDGLTMPHSPRWYQQKLYFFSSATEELFEFDPEKHSLQRLQRFDGFVRGLDFCGRYAFIGVSRLRKSRSFGFLPITEKVIRPGVLVFDLQARSIVGEIVFPNGVDEIFDVKVVANARRVAIHDPKAPGAMQGVISNSIVSWLGE